ncbi:MAG: TolC family outer membrane protein [bacterium]
MKYWLSNHRVRPALKTFIASTLAIFLAGLFSFPVYAETLDDIYRAAVKNDPTLAIAQADFKAVQQDIPIARSKLLPQLDANATHYDVQQSFEDASNLFSDADFTRSTQEIELSQSLFDKGLWDKLSESNYAAEAAKAHFSSARQALIGRVFDAYLGLLEAMDKSKLARLESEIQKKQLNITKRKQQAGIATRTDLQLHRARYDLSISERYNSDNDVQSTRAALTEIIGHTPIQLARLSSRIPLGIPKPNDLNHWINTAVTRNPELQAARLKVKSSKQALDAEQAGHLPTLDLVANYSVKEDDSGFNKGRAEDQRIGLEFNLPIFHGMETVAASKKARQQLISAKKELQKQKLQVINDVRDAFTRLKNSIQQAQVLRRALGSTQQAAKATRRGYQAGTHTALDVYLANGDAYKAQRDYATARYNYVKQFIRLKQAAGVLGYNDIKYFNGYLSTQ